MFKNLFYILTLFFVGGFLIVSCNKDNDDIDDTPTKANVKTYDNEAVYNWNEIFLEVERYAAGYRPGPAPRALAYLGLSAYEACISGMPEFQSVSALYPGLSIPNPDPAIEYHWPSVVNGSYAYLMSRFFTNVPSHIKVIIPAMENQLDNKYKLEAGEEIWQKSKAYGAAVANAIWEWSKTDTYGHDAYLDPFANYTWQDHYDGPGDWEATFPGPGKPMFPHWGKARTFAIKEADKLCPPPLHASDSPNSALYAQALEVYAQSAPTQSYEAKWVGEFWSDDLVNLTFSPGPRWIAIANQVFDQERSNLETAIFANVKIGMAVNDAAVACWYSKYVYNVERPVTYINRVIDPNWVTPLDDPITGEKGLSPSFPAYPSGHSTMGAAGAEALSSIFGYNYAMTDRCHENRSDFVGRPRSFSSFYEMAEENAWSRVPIGVHFRMDSEQGVNLGYRVARKVNDLPWRK